MGMVRLAVVITCALALGACSDGGDSGGPRAEPGPVVVPGDPEGSLLIGKLTGLALCTGSQMPKGDPPLADNLIDTIATWICQGAEDN
jgi:hypothetical protein